MVFLDLFFLVRVLLHFHLRAKILSMSSVNCNVYLDLV